MAVTGKFFDEHKRHNDKDRTLRIYFSYNPGISLEYTYNSYILNMYKKYGDNMRQEDQDKFVRLANKRVSNALKAIQLVGNLSNKSNYDYTDEGVNKILKAIQDELNACKKRFEMATKSSGNIQFSLD